MFGLSLEHDETGTLVDNEPGIFLFQNCKMTKFHESFRTNRRMRPQNIFECACIRFHFTEGAKSGGQEGEALVVQMLGSLAEALERQYGRLVTRLARAFRPEPLADTAGWRSDPAPLPSSSL